jgi:hypothetical protein
MKLHEPTTTLTDYFLALECTLFAVLLLAAARDGGGVTAGLWAAGFAASAVAAAVGGTSHGFVDHVSARTQRVLWLGALAAIGLASACFSAAVVHATFADPLRQWLMVALTAEVLIYWAWIARHDEFRWAVYLYGANMLLVLAIESVAFWRLQAPGAGWIVAGVLVAFAGSAVQRRGIALHRHFNHNDLYHVIQMLALYLIYRGAIETLGR